MRVAKNRYPGGKKKAITMSYDDGFIYDRELIEIFNRYGIRGTFHLNSGYLGDSNRLSSEEVQELYKGHEISCHTSTHPQLDILPSEGIVKEIMGDRKQLEQLAGYPIRGMSYPYSAYTDDIAAALPSFGIEYARTTRSHGGFHLPQNYLTWHPTCHHSDMHTKYQEFQQLPFYSSLPLLYIWGHSYEYHDSNNWDSIVNFCDRAAGDPTVWYATNIEIVEYCNAMKRLRFTVCEDMVYNPSGISVWITSDGDSLEVKPGSLVHLP